MNFTETRDWAVFVGGILIWAFTLGVVYARLKYKVEQAVREGNASRKGFATKEELNGWGARVTAVEGDCSEHTGRMDRFERELSEYRGDTRMVADRLSRVEKGIEALSEVVKDGQLAMGSQLYGIERLIQEKERTTSNRLVRIETVQQIEKKVGPLPAE